jgi:hypothetical protein
MADRPPPFDPLAYRDPTPAPWLIRAIGPVNRHLMLLGLLRLSGFRLPAADLARLRAAVNPGTAAFLAPNHPEFMTDWLIDKEISRLVSPLMAHWASYEIVNGSPLAQRFWLANNLIANAPGGGGKAYSVRWALAGHGVLLHPEGTATWQGDRVGRLLPGAVDMAWDAAALAGGAGSARPVWLVPLAWKLHFTGDAAPGLRREMAHIGRALDVACGDDAVERCFAQLIGGVLRSQCARLGLPPVSGEPGPRYFAEQGATLAAIRERLAARHGPLDADVARAQHVLRRSIRTLAATDPDAARTDRALLAELQRLESFDPALYGVPTLTQERIAETLKRTRSSLVGRGTGNALHNLLPIAVAPRVAHVRVPEPLDVRAAQAAGGDAEVARAALLAALRERLQGAVNAINGAIAPLVDRWRRANPLHDGR